MSSAALLWLLITPIAFAVGFALAWRQHKRRMQARVNDVVAKEIEAHLSEEIQRRILQRLRGDLAAGRTPGSQYDAENDNQRDGSTPADRNQ